MQEPLHIEPLPAFSDNYLWLVKRGRDAVIVDPGDAAVVQAALLAQGLNLRSVLVTHWHPDHIGGLPALHAAWPQAPIYGPRQEAARIPQLSHALDPGASLSLLGLDFDVLALPGHTLGHIAFHAPLEKLLFCGDTLFSGGCGRLFEGTPAQMHGSLGRLAALPDDTAVYCTHEYTLSNLRFAQAVEPGNARLAEYRDQVTSLRAQGRPSLPTRIGLERSINPFLRTRETSVIAQAQQQAGETLEDDVAVFAALRRWKDGFK